MSKALGTIGKVAGVVAGVALIGSGIGAALGGTMVLAGVGSATSIAAVAGAVSAVANMGAQALASDPPAIGQVNDRIIGANNPQPYLIGRSYSGGIQVHDVGYGGEVDDVQNPYRFIATVHSCCGPVESLESVQVGWDTVTFSGTAASGYYSGFFYRDFQLGARPESDALSPQWSGAPDWGASYKLSGFAAIGYSLKWSKEGKRFAGGSLPTIGAIWEGVKVYDPRLDTTYPGGSGSHRIDDETTWAYSRNPALHALAYAYGRYVNGVKVFGVDLGEAAIDLDKIVAWANVCDTNGWTVNGTIYEPGDKWNNLKRICEAGAGQPVLKGGVLSFDYQAARTSLATVTKDDLADSNIVSKLGKGWKNRHNTLVPRFRSEAHQWNYVQADQVSVASFVTADGETKSDERQWDLVTDKDQVTELATYEIYQRREAGPITINCKPHMRLYGPGDCLTLGADLGVHPDGALKTIIRKRTIDPNTGIVSFELEQESDAKHTASLGLIGGVPSAITLPTSEDLDTATLANLASGPAQNLSVIGRAREGFAGVDANPFSKIVASGSAANGDAVSFGTTLGTVPKVIFLPGGAAATAGNEIQIRADGLSKTGFTMKAVEASITPGATITDTTGTAGGGSDPDLLMNRSNSGAPWDGKFKYTFAVTVPTVGGEPGFIAIGIYALKGGVWMQVGDGAFTSTGTKTVTVTPGTVDYDATAGVYEFGISVESATASATLDSFSSVEYTLGTPTETSLTALTQIPWIATLDR